VETPQIVLYHEKTENDNNDNDEGKKKERSMLPTVNRPVAKDEKGSMLT
jgi:hypothetical protein